MWKVKKEKYLHQNLYIATYRYKNLCYRSGGASTIFPIFDYKQIYNNSYGFLVPKGGVEP